MGFGSFFKKKKKADAKKQAELKKQDEKNKSDSINAVKGKKSDVVLYPLKNQKDSTKQ